LRAAFAAGVVALAIFGALHGAPFLSVICSGLAIYLVIGAFSDIAMRVAPRGTPLRSILARLRGLPLSAFGTSIAHAGVGLTLLGLAATGWGVESIVAMRKGVAYDVGPYKIEIEDVATRNGPNYAETFAAMTVREGETLIARIEPSKRFYQARRMARTEAGIVTLGLGQVYVALGEQHEDGSLDARLYYKPLVTLIWLGALAMALGGACSLADRRLRIGVAARARAAAQPQAAE
jgi:cytochrome c-type biogenesis protein CcmF